MSYNTITEHSYTLVEKPGMEFYGVKFNEQPYKDVVIVYGSVSLKENQDTGDATMKFNYVIEEAADFTEGSLEHSQDFNNYCGDVLKYILTTSLNDRTGKIGKDDPTQYTYIKSPFEQ